MGTVCSGSDHWLIEVDDKVGVDQLAAKPLSPIGVTKLAHQIWLLQRPSQLNGQA